jgi:hypothetical protein
MSTRLPHRIAVVVASTGRPTELGRWVDHVKRQTLAPAKVVYAAVKPTDLPEHIPEGVLVVTSASGLPIQRNAALEGVKGDCDLIAYFDDDFVPSSFCMEGIAALFGLYPDVVAANGTLIADGINSPGISYEDAAQLVAQHDQLPRESPMIFGELSGLYGCNMVYRMDAVGEERFDEQLPLYAWQEDIDFAARVGRRGRIVKTNAFHGVHQGIKDARLPGVRLGYSQIVNPLYLVRKGTLSRQEATKLVAKNIAMNHARALFPEPWIDRAGRCKGNWLATIDVLLGRDHPKNILALPR